MIEGAYFSERDFAHQAFEFLKTPTKSDPELGQCLFPTAPKIHFIEWGKLISPHSSEDSRFKDWVHFLLPQSVEDWERIAGDDPMFSELKMKVELYSADDKLAMQQRAIDEAR
jgi:hypothetical protein